LVSHPRFRAAYDFLVLRAQSGEADPELADWWTQFQEADAGQRSTMLEGSAKRKRPRRRKPAVAGAAAELGDGGA
ncbi:MAG TPA: polynucleotide adenylyltransferase PcnB, partial [Lamprocystis sp. (in: g-proteobacteria)]|nr:polynucleotide adenylyltransferase PcnB [Lamprocystis sp. (in: g-proteobacteria)]